VAGSAWRLLNEKKFFRENLQGYAEYTHKVRYPSSHYLVVPFDGKPPVVRNRARAIPHGYNIGEHASGSRRADHAIAGDCVQRRRPAYSGGRTRKDLTYIW
jgi:hypothetical protein